MRRTSVEADGSAARRPRAAALIDYRFRRSGGMLSTERAFALFLFALEPRLGSLTLIGRLDPAEERYPYEVPARIGFVGLPFYPSLAHPAAVLRGLIAATRRMWRALDDVDVVWSLGPGPSATILAVAGLLRGRRVVLGVRQDLPAYARRRHPRRHWLHLLADALERAFRLLARRCAVVVVGADLAARYAHARELHVLHVSLVPADAVLEHDPPRRGPFAGRIVSVGRLDEEKNPLLLVDVAALLASDREPHWTLEIYGDGPLAEPLRRRIDQLGLGERVRLRGYVALHAGLADAYAGADAFLHVSWTEGMPQVLLEAFAARLPTVATDVGGVASLAGDAALLVGPGDAAAAAAALRRLADEPPLRGQLVAAGTRVAREHTLEREAERVARFLAGGTTP